MRCKRGFSCGDEWARSLGRAKFTGSPLLIYLTSREEKSEEEGEREREKQGQGKKSVVNRQSPDNAGSRARASLIYASAGIKYDADGAHREIAIAGTSILPRAAARIFPASKYRRRSNVPRPGNKLDVRPAIQKVGQTAAAAPAGVAFRTARRKRRGELISRVLRAGWRGGGGETDRRRRYMYTGCPDSSSYTIKSLRNY